MLQGRDFASRRSLLLLLAASSIFLAALLWQLAAEVQRPSRTQPNPVELSADSNIERLQNVLQQDPDNADAYALLGLAYLQKVRETGDVQFYNRAEGVLAKALVHDPEQLHGLLGQGLLALARHDFQSALVWGEKARTLYPYNPEALGILVDANVELGRYETAVSVLQEMVDLRPNQASYSRVSYLRELHGDVDGAIDAMQKAVQTGIPGREGTLWAQVQLGHLYFNRGDWAQAEAIYKEALHFQPDYPYALAGIARVHAARGNYTEAIAIYQPLVERYPLAEFAISLGDLYSVTGQTEAAAHQYELVRLIQALNVDAGLDMDLELALFETDYGSDPAGAVDTARAVYERRPSILAADVLAWALYRNGDYEAAWKYSQKALRLGTRDALLHYHAGMIAAATGERATARRLLQEALAINPAFSIRYTPAAKATLTQLSSP